MICYDCYEWKKRKTPMKKGNVDGCDPVLERNALYICTIGGAEKLLT